MTEVREPTKEELRGAKFVVAQLDACGDNADKKIRFLAMLMATLNDEIAEHKQVTAMHIALNKKRLLRMKIYNATYVRPSRK